MDGGKGSAMTGVAEDAGEDDANDGSRMEGEDEDELDLGTATSQGTCPGTLKLPCVYVHGSVKNEKSFKKL